MTERIAFIDQTSRGIASFIESARLEPRTINKMLPQDKVSYLLMAYSECLSALENSGEEAIPHLWVIENNPKEFLKAAQELEKDYRKDTSLFSVNCVRDFFHSLTLVKLEAETHSDTVDEKTGIRVVGLTKGQFAFPMHPTPTD